MICFGFILSYCTGYGFLNDNISDVNYYKIILALPAFPCLLRSILLLYIFKTDQTLAHKESVKALIKSIENDKNIRDGN